MREVFRGVAFGVWPVGFQMKLETSGDSAWSVYTSERSRVAFELLIEDKGGVFVAWLRFRGSKARYGVTSVDDPDCFGCLRRGADELFMSEFAFPSSGLVWRD